MSIRQARLYGACDLRVDTVPQPDLRAGTVRVDVAYTGICGSDLHEYTSGPMPIRAERTDHHLPADELEAVLPKPMGHEVAGTVSEVATEVTGIEVGDRVTLNMVIPCRECRYCDEANYHLCARMDGRVVNTPGFADELVVPASTVIHVPDAVSLHHAAVVEPLAVSLHAVNRAALTPGETCAVFGAGPIGLGIVAAATASGAGEVIVSEPRAARRKAATTLGATHTLDPAETDPIGSVRDRADGGTDVTFDAAGKDQTLTAALRSTKYDGTVVAVSVFEDTVSVHPNDIVHTERRLIGSFAFEGGPRRKHGEFPAILRMLADERLEPAPMLSDVIALDDVDDGFTRLLEPTSDAIKILVEP